jgi:DUF3046 family protein
VRLSEFRQAVADEFGDAHGNVLLHDLVLGDLGGKTAEEALTSGAPARDVWFALCAAADVPKSHWYTAGRPASKNVE